MKYLQLTLFVSAVLASCKPAAPTSVASGAAPPPEHAPPPRDCSASYLDIDGSRIWVNREGRGNITVAFEAGFGNDSSVWADLTPKIRAAGAQTFVYDRAGMGKSTINGAVPYSVDNDVHILKTALQTCGVHAPIVVVGHSYGGAMALIAATEQPSIRALVLLDAVVPNVWPPTEVEKNLRVMRTEYAEIREKAPELAKVAIPWAEALPDTAKRINTLVVSETLPITDIVAESGRSSPESNEIWLNAHRAFTSNHARREFLLAAGSGHKVMVDKPELVLRAILKTLDSVANAAGNAAH